ncbi:MAG: 50S ribosomal protein L1 [Anaerolineae bacterium]|nr:50S ribosomal protein L1 [Anaerolineae bacterium]
MPKHGKKYLNVAEKIDPERTYAPQEAIDLVKETSFTKFDATVEVHMRLGVDPRHADQMVRGVVLLPNGLGKTVRILVFAEGDEARIAEEAGADFVGSDDLVQKIQDGWFEFDTVLATPPMMRVVGRLGRSLGPRGLMPNPKAGTIVQGDDLERVIKEARLGRVEFRVDKTSNLHAPIGKTSFEAPKLLENMTAFVDAVRRARPSAAKGTYIRKVVLTSTMGPGIKVDPILVQGFE